ncbi:MAG: UvrB/UvrC motif-containing protein [Candidatus Cyclobacteriaceae bacterium M2_1C_046]
MKLIFIRIFTIFLFLFAQLVSAQDFNEMSINEMEKLKNQAVANENFTKAAKIKKAIELKQKLDEAVANEDYELAAKLKKQLRNGATGNGNQAPSVTSNSGSSGSSMSNGKYDLDFYNTAYLFDKSNDQVINLEKKTAEIKTTSYSAVFVAGASSYWVVNGLTSEVKLDRNKDYTFLVRVANGVDPSTIFKLAQLELTGREEISRSLLSFKTTAAAYAGGSTDQNTESNVNVSFKKVDEEVYEVVINEVLPPGEYAFVFGDNWFLFSNESQFSNSGLPIISRDTKAMMYDTEGECPKSVWFSIDYSLAKIITNQIKASDDEIRENMYQAATALWDKHVKHGRVEAWLRKEEQGVYYNPFYSLEKAKSSVKNRSMVTNDQEFQLTDEDIENHLGTYEVNYPGLGLVIIPEAFNTINGTAKSYAVWFDFDSRKVVYKYPINIRSDVNDKAKAGGFVDDFILFTKSYIDKDHKNNVK